MKILLLSHGKFSLGLKESYSMIAGENDKIMVHYLDEDGIGVFAKKLVQILDEMTKASKVIVLTDIKGGTPYNESLKYQLENPGTIEIVTGMNLPMLIEIGMGLEAESNLENLAKLAVEVGKDSIVRSEFDEELEEDDDLEF